MSNKIKVKYGNTELFSTDYPYNALDIKYKNNIISTIYPEETVGLNTKEKSCDGNFDISGYTLNTNGTKCTENIFISNELPYEELEYIESTGTQWIDTGIPIGTDILRMKTNFYKTSSAYRQILFGGCTAGETVGMYFIYTEDDDPSEKMLLFTDGQGGHHITYPNYGLEPGVRTIEYAKSGWTTMFMNVNGATSSTAIAENPSGISSATYYLFCDNSNGNPIYQYSCQLRYYNIWTADGLIRSFIPVRRKSDSVVCLYDTVTQQYYENIGSGNFIAGPAVKYTKLDYIDFSGEQIINTGVVPKNTTFNIDATYFEADTGMGTGYHSESANQERFLISPYENNASELAFGIGGWYTTSFTPALNTRHFYEINMPNHTYTYDDNIISYTPMTTSFTPNKPIYLCARNYYDIPCVHGRLFSSNIYEDNVLIRKFIPVQRSGSLEIGMLDLVSKIFYRNMGSGEFYHPNALYEYEQLDYLESHGVEWINTEYVHVANTWIDATTEFTQLYSYNMLCGQWAFLAVSLKSDGGMTIGCGGQETQSLAIFGANTKYRIRFGSGTTVYINNSTYALGSGDNTLQSYPIFIFGAGDGSAPPYAWECFGKVKVYAFSIYEGTTNDYSSKLVHNYLPVRRKIDGVLGLYDTVDHKFLQNKGTGSFTAGPVKSWKSIEYIEYSGEQYINTTHIPQYGVYYKFDVIPLNTTGYGCVMGSLSGSNANRHYFLDNIGDNRVNYVYCSNYKSAPSILARDSVNHVELYPGKIIVNSEETVFDMLTPTNTTRPVYLGAFNNSGLVQEPLIGRLYNYQIYYADGMLKHDFIPVLVSPSNIACMYDKVTNLYYSNCGNNALIPGPIYNPGYTELEYIQSNGTQMIDTDVAFNTFDIPITIKAKCAPNDSTGVKYTIAGCGDSQWNGPVMMNFCNNVMEFGTSGYTAAGSYTPGNINLYTCLIDSSNQSFKQDSTEFLSTTRTFVGASARLYLFCFNVANSSLCGQYSGKLYSFKLWIGSTIVRNFIPVRRNSDNVVCMYDTVTCQYFENVGTGEFIGGPEV